MEQKNKKYFAFISYKRADEEWAKWFQNELENYHFPSTLNGRTDIADIISAIPEAFRPPKEFRPVFRDYDELIAGNLPEQIYSALQRSLNLVVICSPHLADDEEAKWVNKEISDFIEIGEKEGLDNTRRIFPFIVEGKPHSGDEHECFPKVLRDLSAEQERIGGNVNEGGDVSEINRERAFVKVLAGMLPEGVNNDMLWPRYDHDKMERERKEKEARDKLLIAQSRFVAEKAIGISKEDSYLAQRLAVEVLPQKLEDPNRPYTAESEFALRNACKFNSAVFRGHEGFVMSTCFSPDGKYVLSASLDKTVRIWNVETGTGQILPGESFEGFNWAVFSPDGEMIAAASCDSSIHIWRTNKGNPEYLKKIVGHTNIVRYIAFDDNGTMMLSASDDKTIKIWDITTWKDKKTLIGHSNMIYHAVFSPDGSKIASSSTDRTIRVWDVNTGKEIHHPTEGIMSYSVSFINDGNQIMATSAYKRSIVVLDTETGVIIKQIPTTHVDYIKYLYNITDSYIITTAGDKDCSIKIWNLDSEQEVATFKGHTKGISSVDYKDGKLVSASWDKTIRIWNVGFNGKYDVEKHIISSCAERIESIKISPNNKRAVFTSQDGTANLWNIDTTHMIKALNGHKKIVRCAAYSKDSKLVATGSFDETIKIWDANTGKELITIYVGAGVGAISFNSVGTQIAVGSGKDQLIHLFDISSGKQINVFKGHKGFIYAIAFSPNDSFIVSGSNDNTMRIWDVKTGNQIGDSKVHDGTVYSIAFCENGKMIASGSGDNDNLIRLWNVDDKGTIKETKRFKGHINNVHSVAFCKKEEGEYYLISASSDKTIRVWDVGSAKEVNVIDKHDNRVLAASLDQKNYQIISASADGTIRIWDFQPLQNLIDQTRKRFKYRPLTPEERKMYYLE